MLRHSLALLACLLVSAPVCADGWADGLFKQTSKDFGAVPHGPVLTHPFRVTNNTKENVHVLNLRVSCGCVTAKMERSELAPGQSTLLMTEMHTDRFLGDKTVSIYVLFDRPEIKEVSLEVKARSCDEVVVTPESLDFGRGQHGEVRKVEALVTLPGMEKYQIEKVTADSSHVHPTLTEIPSDNGSKVYRIKATLDAELGVGMWYTEVWLHTNHPWMERIRVPVLAEVEPALTVSPANMKMEAPAPGQRVQRKVLIHANSPFKILSVKGADEQWSVHDDTPGSAPQHILTISLQGMTTDGPVQHCFQVLTDMPGEANVEFRAEAGNDR